MKALIVALLICVSSLLSAQTFKQVAQGPRGPNPSTNSGIYAMDTSKNIYYWQVSGSYWNQEIALGTSMQQVGVGFWDSTYSRNNLFGLYATTTSDCNTSGTYRVYKLNLEFNTWTQMTGLCASDISIDGSTNDIWFLSSQYGCYVNATCNMYYFKASNSTTYFALGFLLQLSSGNFPTTCGTYAGDGQYPTWAWCWLQESQATCTTYYYKSFDGTTGCWVVVFGNPGLPFNVLSFVTVPGSYSKPFAITTGHVVMRYTGTAWVNGGLSGVTSMAAETPTYATAVSNGSVYLWNGSSWVLL